MNRKLHNSLMALVASSGLLVVGLMAASPTAPAMPGSDGPVLAETRSEAQASGAGSERTPMRQVRRGRPSVAMPYFSFAPRG